MHLERFSYATTLHLLLLIVILLNLNHSLSLSEPPNDFAVDCGTSGNFNGNYNQKWIGDIGSKFLSTSQGSKATSVKSKIAHLPYFVPYTSARISYKQFSYRFEVGSGQKFIRLYFYPTTFTNFEKSSDFFTVKAGPYTLLSNFSASLTADAAGVKYFTKEYCINVGENQLLTITFSPTIGGYEGKTFAFVNGIEIISMPHGLYYTPVGELGINVVGKKYQLSVDESIALEMIHRLNVGGSSISPDEDTGFSREWSGDSNYFLNSDVRPVSTSIKIKYKSIPNYIAPHKVYQTSWATGLTKEAENLYNFTWKLPVDLGFRYLIRFHFCELEYEIEEGSRLRFIILINNQLVEANADVIKWSGGSGIAIFKDYVAVMKGERMEGKRDLLISLSLKWNESTDAILKGLEIFKLSNPDNNLAGVNPSPIMQYLSSAKLSPRKFVYAHGGNLISTVIIILISSVSIIVYQLRILGEKYGDINIISASPSEGRSRRFSLAEVRSATNNFDNLLVIGSGGFGLVYKGVIDNGTIIVAIKRLNSQSKQGAEEFWTEIKMLSKLRHTHLVSLIGYCDEGREMILVYEYMEQGTLADHLYKNRNNSGINFDLSWEQKLNICMGAARGLDYLHTGTRHGVIHRDVKTTNILLDNEWVAKISDFGLCKVGATSHSRTHVSTNVKGTFGYLDPEYFLTRRLTKKSDVYAFGVVLLEVLCGRPAVDISLSDDRRSLALWGQHCIKEGKFDDLIGPDLQDQISSPCLKIFTEVAYKCLNNRPNGRPTMSDVVASLESALISQNHSGEISSEKNDEEEESDNDSIFDTIQLNDDNQQNPIPSPTTPVQDSENMLQNKKKTKGMLSKAFQWSLGIFIPTKISNSAKKKKKKIDDSSSRQSWLNSDSTGDELLWNNNNLHFRRFTIAEIKAATNNFNKNLKLGEGGFGITYKGWIDNGTLEVAINKKPLNADELLTSRAEIQAHSQLSHLNIISLLGYCDHKDKMILVYSYMVNKSLDHHIYGEKSRNSPLPWAKRLEICIGAAKGLQYLHYGTTQKIIHRDIKPSNILLDENWVAKISDFELSKVANPDHVTCTCVCGTYGYLDPEYICHLKLTEKSDVYAFGVVLLEIVCARKPCDFSLDEEQSLLVHWFRTCIRERKIDQVIDPYLIGRISPECLMQYLKIAWGCLLDWGNKRPNMNSVVESLQIAQQLQENWYIDAEIDNISENWIPSLVGRAYNNVLEYQYGGSFEHSGIYLQVNYSGNIDPSLTADFLNDPSLGLTEPLR